MKKRITIGIVLLGWSIVASGQVTTGTISGMVKDSTGAVIPAAHVAVRNVGTGISRTVATDTAGRYTVPQLGPGSYDVSVSAQGFQTTVQRGMQLSVGQESVVNFNLQLGTVAEQVTVTGEAPLIEATTSSISGVVTETQMRDLPLNARSYEQLALLQPNVFWNRNSKPSTNTGYAPRISAAGMRSGYNSFVVDGVDIMDTTGQSPGSAAGQLMGVETLREFRVLTNNYSAQYGRAVGAVIDVVSRGGTNDLHGTAFEFLRNDALDARSFFDVGKPPFRRSQFGGVLGGPITKNRLFFFGSYEALRQGLTSTSVFFVPNADARRGILPDPRDASRTITVPVSPAVVPYLAAYPTPQRDVGGGLGIFTHAFATSTREDYVAGRIDYQRSENVSYFGRYTYDYTTVIEPRLPVVLPPWMEGLVSKNHTFTLAETRVINPHVINEFRAAFVRYAPQSHNVLSGPDPKLTIPSTAGIAWIAVGGASASNVGAQMAPLGSAATRPFEEYVGNTYQFVDNLNYTAGAHSLKWGATLERFQDNVGNLTPGQGLYQYSGSFASKYTFNTLQDLLAGTPFSFGGVLTPSAVGISGRQWLYAFYLQDDYRLRPNLTLNLGLRYESVSNYSNLNHRFIILHDLFDAPKTGQKYAWEGQPCRRCVDPRFGFAWDVFSNGKTALRGGFGMFHNQLGRFHAYFPTPVGTPGGVDIVVDNPSFPDPTVPNANSVIRTAGSGTGGNGVTILPRIPRTPTALHWNLAVNQQMTPSMSVQVAYEGSHGYHLDGGYTVNTNTSTLQPDGSIFFAPGIHRIRPDFGAVEYAAYDFNSFYNALAITVSRRISRGLGFETSYAFSRSTDDTTLGLSQGAHLTTEIRTLDGRRNGYHGLSGLHMKHRFINNFTYELPRFASHTGFASKIVSGWQVNGIATLQAGTPVTPLVGFDRANSRANNANGAQRVSLSPSLRGPVPICPCSAPASLGGGRQSAPERYFDPTAFTLPAAGTYGNAGRNIIIGPGLATFDFAVVKNTALTERFNLQFRAESFNLMNSVNWAAPNTNIFQSNGAITGGAGSITNVITPGRQLQFALKVSF